jgi:hypothetical protein
MILMMMMIIIITIIVIIKMKTKMMKKSRFAIDDAEAENFEFKGWLGLT